MNLPADEVLMCQCGRELAVLEIAGRPTLAHTTNPTFQHHYPKAVRRSRTPARSRLGAMDQPELEAADTRLGQAANAVASPDGRASGRSGVPTRSMSVTQPSEQGRSQQVPSPVRASAPSAGSRS